MVVASSRVVVGPFEVVVASVVANLKFYIWHFLLHINQVLMGLVGCSDFLVFLSFCEPCCLGLFNLLVMTEFIFCDQFL